MKKSLNNFLLLLSLFLLIIAPVYFYRVSAINYRDYAINEDVSSGGVSSGGSTATTTYPDNINTPMSNPFYFSVNMDPATVNEGSVNINATATVQFDDGWTNWNDAHIYTILNENSLVNIFSNDDYTFLQNGGIKPVSSSLEQTIVNDMFSNNNFSSGYIPYESLDKSEMNITITKPDGSSEIVSGDIGNRRRTQIGLNSSYSKESYPIPNISNLTANDANYNAVFKANPYVYVLDKLCRVGWGLVPIQGGGYAASCPSDITRTLYKRTFPMSNSVPFTVLGPTSIDFVVQDNKNGVPEDIDISNKRTVRGVKYGDNKVKVTWDALNIIDKSNIVCTTPVGSGEKSVIHGEYYLLENLTKETKFSVFCEEAEPSSYSGYPDIYGDFYDESGYERIFLNIRPDKHVPYAKNGLMTILSNATVYGSSFPEANLRVTGYISGPEGQSTNLPLLDGHSEGQSLSGVSSIIVPSTTGVHSFNVTATKYDPSGIALRTQDGNGPQEAAGGFHYQADDGTVYWLDLNYRGRIIRATDDQGTEISLPPLGWGVTDDYINYIGEPIEVVPIGEGGAIKTYSTSFNFDVL